MIAWVDQTDHTIAEQWTWSCDALGIEVDLYRAHGRDEWFGKFSWPSCGFTHEKIGAMDLREAQRQALALVRTRIVALADVAREALASIDGLE
jgi:hypothetical protein